MMPRPTADRVDQMLLERCTWQEVEDYLEGSKGILLPVGSTEQHGPNGLIGTDAICAELVARGVGETTGAMVAPTLNFGMAQHHMAFRGTMTLRPQTLLAVLVDLLNSLAQHGFERCLVINGHGGNMATIMAAFSELHAAASLNVENRTSRLRCRMRNWWGSPAVTELQKELFGDRDGSHATASEISVTQYALSGIDQAGDHVAVAGAARAAASPTPPISAAATPTVASAPIPGSPTRPTASVCTTPRSAR